MHYLDGYPGIPAHALVVAAARHDYISVILCELRDDDRASFVVWTYNHQTEGASGGKYCADYATARAAYLKRAGMYLPAPWDVRQMQA